MRPKKQVKVMNKKLNKDKHIRLVSNISPYNIKEDLSSTPANISVAQLLDVSLKVRIELVKNFIFRKNEAEINTIHKGKIPISKC